MGKEMRSIRTIFTSLILLQPLLCISMEHTIPSKFTAEEAFEYAQKYPKLRKFIETAASNIEVIDEKGRTLLHHALIEGDADFAAFLVSRGANVNCRSTIGETPISLALSHIEYQERCWGIPADTGEQNIFELLTNKGTKISNLPSQFHPILQRAVYNRNVRIALALLKGGADINEIDKYGDTPLHKAAHQGDILMVELFLKWGANFKIKNNANKTAAERTYLNDEILNLIKKYENGTLLQDDKSRYEASTLDLVFAKKTAATLLMYLDKPSNEKEAAELMDLLKQDPMALSFAKRYMERHLISVKDYIRRIKNNDANLLYEYELLPPNFIINR